MWKKTGRWLVEHPYGIWYPVCMLLYLVGFFSLEFVTYDVVHFVESPLDELIPFCEWFVLPYISWYLPFGLGPLYFLRRDKEAYLRLCFAMFVSSFLVLGFYVLYPTGLTLRQSITGDNFCCTLVELIRAADTPYNVCPSLHVSTSAILALVSLRASCLKGQPVKKLLITLWMLLIIGSTVFIKQHSVLDVFWGLVVSLVFYGSSLLLPLKEGKKRGEEAK